MDPIRTYYIVSLWKFIILHILVTNTNKNICQNILTNDKRKKLCKPYVDK